MKILIAEDDPVTNKLIESNLKKWGYEVITASNGDEAWELFQELREPLVIILDWMMPGASGLEVCTRIVRSEPVHPVHIIFLTARDEAKDVVKGFAAGASDFIRKPCDVQELKARILIATQMIDLQSRLRERMRKLEEGSWES